MMFFRPISYACLLAVSLAFLIGCSEITEQEMAYESGLHMISADLEVIHSIPEIPGAASLLVYPGRLFVACTDGYVRVYDPADLELLYESQVGLASPAGYTSFIFSPSENTAYLTGDQGRILELEMPSCEVISEFSVCTAPTVIEITSGNPGHLWVLDGIENTVYSVELDDHTETASTRFLQLDQINSLEASGYEDSLMCTTCNGAFRLEMFGNTIRRTCVDARSPSNWGAISRIPNDSNFVALKSYGSSWQIGILSPYIELASIPPVPYFHGAYSVSGLLWLSVPGNDNHNVFAAGYQGDGISTLYRYSYIEPVGVKASADFQGYPLDMGSSGAGNLYLLTVSE